MENLEEFTDAVIEALYCTDTGLDSEATGDVELSPETEANLRADCRSFWARCWFYVKAAEKTVDEAGHDFWLTRNGHGAGFWDGDWDDTPYADLLTKLSQCYGTFETYLGDDGLLHH